MGDQERESRRHYFFNCIKISKIKSNLIFVLCAYTYILYVKGAWKDKQQHVDFDYAGKAGFQEILNLICHLYFYK